MYYRFMNGTCMYLANMPGSTVIMTGQLHSNGTGHMEKLTGFECIFFESGGFRCLGKQAQNLGCQ